MHGEGKEKEEREEENEEEGEGEGERGKEEEEEEEAVLLMTGRGALAHEAASVESAPRGRALIPTEPLTLRTQYLDLGARFRVLALAEVVRLPLLRRAQQNASASEPEEATQRNLKRRVRLSDHATVGDCRVRPPQAVAASLESTHSAC